MERDSSRTVFEGQRLRSCAIQAAAEQLLMDIAEFEAEKTPKG
jgi:hypothetical protein